MRFYDVNFGKILLDGVDIRKYNLQSLRKYISLVMQEPQLFNISIKENILYGNLNAKNSDIDWACEVACCREFIKNKEISGLEDTPEQLMKTLEENKDGLIKKLNKHKYEELISLLKALQKINEKKGEFQYIPNEIDKRSDELKDVELDEGYDI